MRLLVISILALGLQACGGTFGGTKSFTLDVDQPAGSELHHVVQVASVDIASDANEVDSVGTYHIGKMDKGEIADLRKSLVSTLGQVKWPAPSAAVSTLGVHLLITNYYVAHSNNDGAVLAVVDWALASPASEVVFSEQFFASMQASDIKGLNTLGKLKNQLNEQIVRRVADSSTALAADTNAKPAVAVEHTYVTIEDAAAPLPKRLTSLFGLPTLSTKGIDWTKGAPKEPVDWSQRLATQT